jgi:uncharacterized hydrophobic protein (TIGR00271 family)
MPRIFTPISRERQVEVIRSLDQAGTFSNDYLLLVMLSCVIATFGLVLDSAAVIIGAMLIAPLMSPILRCALALVRGDLARFGQAFVTLLVGVLLAVGLSALFGLLVSTGEFNFLEELPSEVVGRTRPNLFDLVVALAGGTAAAYALAQPHLSAALPGVAIATALMPPLCTIGIGISQSRTDVSSGALLLFLANLTAILFASSLTFTIVGFRPAFASLQAAILTRVLLIEGVLVLLIVAVLSGLMVRIIGEAQENRAIRLTLIETLAQDGGSLVSFERQAKPDHLTIVATIRSPRSLTLAEANRVQRELVTRLQRSVALKLLVIPLTSLNPLVPPTLTPTIAPDATATPTPAPTGTPTAEPTVSPTAAPTTTPTPPPIATSTPTTIPSITATPVSYAVVGATGGRGANVRRVPGRSAIITALRDGTLVQTLGQSTAADGLDWVAIVLPDGRVGWIADDYLIPYRTFVVP